jgi:tRNA threonylcarbamoyladenosine biosynthesis protein TsaB
MAYNNAMKLIAIETSTEACSAALLINGVISDRYQLAPREHTALILPMIDELLANAGLERSQLEAVAFGRGPGGFTGVRIATGVAQGIAFALNIPVAPVSTLAALAHRVWRETGHKKIACAIDARMGEVYWACYLIEGNGKALLVGEELVCAPQAVPLLHGGGWAGAGSGWDSYGDALKARLGSNISSVVAGQFPHAHDVALLGATMLNDGDAVSAASAMPVYLRDQVVHKKKEGS